MTQLSRFLYGGDYNPEQWPEDTWANDIQVFKQAHLNSATINVFSWALLEQREGEYDFSKLDKIVKELSDANFDIVLATATAAMPAWMFKKYPDVARVDYQGRRHVFGQRHNFCSNSKNYQVQNAFRDWLKYKYKNLETLNKAWNMNVWGHRIYDWDEIVVPNELGDAWGAEGTETIVSALSLDYLRFQSESLLKLFKMEKAIIKKYDPVALVTTNFHALPNKLLDYQKWAKEQDIISYDSYPSYNMPTYQSAFLYDLMRSLKHQPFMLMESTPAQVNWQPYSPLKRPGQMAATELQAVAHGADTVQFFQLKQAIGGSEKFHSAVISHSQRTDTRVFKEVTELGEKLEKTGSTILGSKTKAKVGIVFDWNNFWSYEYIDGITQDLDYVESILDYYKQFYKRNIPTDIISVDDDFSQYDLVVAPVLYMIKSGLAEKIDQYVKKGGNFVASYLSGIVNENDSVYLGGYPGPLKDVLGIWVEESDAVIPGQKITVSLDSNNYQANLICDLLHLEGAHALGNYNSEFYKETPAVSENQWGKGTSWYIGTQLDEAGLSKIFDHLISIVNIKSLIETKTDLEITKRVTKSGKELYFVLNMSNDTKDLPSEFDAYKNLFTDKSANKKMKAWEVQLLSKL